MLWYSRKTSSEDIVAGQSRRTHIEYIVGEHSRETNLEMGLRQFRTVSQLLNKLKVDLHLSYNSFVREFISDPNDGVVLLLDLLKRIQLSCKQ